ncbi:LysR family transcriptional regulator [uncultured Sulfitobacter sp.]|uniref:LysR family transcriptional regulator n=1 Tax=uncultured Sulfitobacter sp. TaxID=191468 RepID=UPI0026328693|nr:LysR family transcriptional regulator [uncultured Sulfitobacter sp.]
MSITHNQLIAMLAVIDCGTFDRAAVRLNLSQSTVTKRIQELEASMGFLVFDRSKRQAILTHQGEQFAALSRETVASFANLSSFNSGMKARSTKVSLGVTEISSLTWLPRFLEISFENDPAIQFDLTIDMSRNLHSSLEDGDLDLIVVPEMPFQSNANVERLTGVELTLVGRSGLVPEGEIVELSQLQSFEFITQGKSSGYSKSIRDWFANNGLNLRNSVSVDSLHAMVGLALAGRGVCIAPRDYLIPMIRRGRIAEILTEPKLPTMNYCVVHHPSPHATLFKRIAYDIQNVADFQSPYFV